LKRIVISISIGVLCSLLYLAISGLNNKKSKGSLLDTLSKPNSSKQAAETLYKGTVKLAIDNSIDSAQKLKKTLNQVEKRMDNYFAGMTEDSGFYILSVKGVTDTSYLKKMLTESVKIEFKETFSLGTLSESLTKANEEMMKSDNSAIDKKKEYDKILETDTAKEKLSTILAGNEVTDLKLGSGLASFIRFSQPFSMPSGENRYPSELGYVRSNDTAALNQVLERPQIANLFPSELSFAYGSGNFISSSGSKDSILSIYAIKNVDTRYLPCPTAEQIARSEMSFDPYSGSPTILFEFNDAGSHAWYEMTRRNVGKPIAMMANNFVLSCPSVESAIDGGSSRITGAFSVDECRYLAKMIGSEELAQPVKIVETKFTVESSNKSKRFKILGIIFLITTALAYGISLILKPNSKP
jgi:SecD/SecF fusion protein